MIGLACFLIVLTSFAVGIFLALRKGIDVATIWFIMLIVGGILITLLVGIPTNLIHMLGWLVGGLCFAVLLFFAALDERKKLQIDLQSAGSNIANKQ